MSTVTDDYGTIVKTGTLAAKIGARIRDARIGRAWQQGDLARELGISQSALSKIECGQTVPNAIRLQVIACALCVTVGSFFGEAA